MLGDDSFKMALASKLKQLLPALLDVICEQRLRALGSALRAVAEAL
jgi:hypothetical protein